MSPKKSFEITTGNLAGNDQPRSPEGPVDIIGDAGTEMAAQAGREQQAAEAARNAQIDKYMATGGTAANGPFNTWLTRQERQLGE